MPVDHSRDRLLTSLGKILLSQQYCLPGEKPQDAYYRASAAFSGGDHKLKERLYDYASHQWHSFATPLLANGGSSRGLPISCFLNFVDDSVSGLVENFRENAFMSTNGGGIGTYWGAVRSIGEVTSKGVDTPGAMAFMHVQDSQVIAYHQGSTRRGAASTYMDVSHPEIIDFVNMRSVGGDVHRTNENLHHGVCIPDAFMEAVQNDEPWDLIDPHSKTVKETVSARGLWIHILSKRKSTGEPFLFFVDTANRAMPETQKALGLKIHHTNLCTEITLPTAPDRTAVCCLSSLNIAKLDEWWPHREQLIFDLVKMLDNTLDVFLSEAPNELWRAKNSVRKERAIGLGTLGFHTYLQQRGCLMSSAEARKFNIELYKEIKRLADAASAKLAEERGEPEEMKGTGLRNSTRTAIAPNAGSSLVCGGVSPSCEPLAMNAFAKKVEVGTHEVRNPVLAQLLESKRRNDDDTWASIVVNEGSVKHLDFLTDYEKRLFETSEEIDQQVLINLAIDRQPYICQAQSINLFIPRSISAKDLNQLHMSAYRGGLKSLYYVHSASVKATGVGTNEREKEEPAQCKLDDPNCSSCEA